MVINRHDLYTVMAHKKSTVNRCFFYVNRSCVYRLITPPCDLMISLLKLKKIFTDSQVDETGCIAFDAKVIIINHEQFMIVQNGNAFNFAW